MKRSSSLAVVEMSTEAVYLCNTDYHWSADVLFSFVAYELVQHDICNVEPRTVYDYCANFHGSLLYIICHM